MRGKATVLAALAWGAALPVQADALGDAIDHALDAPGLRGGIAGVMVERLSDGQILYARNPNGRLMPASNRKLFTSAAALAILGGQYRIVTEVRAERPPDPQGTLTGDLFLTGGGDGLLSVADLDALAAQVAKAGVRRIAGNIVGDGTRFTDGPYGEGWEWDDLSDDYAPEISALEANEGIVTIHANAGPTVGAPVTFTLDPPSDRLTVVNSARTVAADAPTTCRFFRPLGQNVLILRGGLPLGKTFQDTATVHDPPRFAAALFRDALRRQGVTVTGRVVTRQTPPGSVPLASHASLPLSEYLAKLNKPSDNLLAESLIRLVGLAKRGEGTYAAGDAEETAFLKQIGVETSLLTLADGSGVSRRNCVTARSVVQLLAAMHSRPDGQTYSDSLPIMGVDGTLKSRLKGTLAAGNVHAKTGTLTGASALSGYVTRPDGTLCAFAILLNNYSGGSRAARAAQDAIALALATER